MTMQYVALLRGINVGGNNKVEMPRLKAVFERLGFTDVVTYINSGNIVFASHTTLLPQNIEDAIEAEFGFRSKTLVKSADNIARVCSALPDDWQNDSEQKTDVLFLWEEADSPDAINEITQTPNVDNLLYVDGAIIWNIKRKDQPKSKMDDFIKNPLYKQMTARNCNTVRKLGTLLT